MQVYVQYCRDTFVGDQKLALTFILNIQNIRYPKKAARQHAQSSIILGKHAKNEKLYEKCNLSSHYTPWERKRNLWKCA
jgi:hypothetical protein